MKKKIAKILLIICLVSGCGKKEISRDPNYIEELRGLGYQEEIIEELKDKLSPEEMDKITEFDHVEVLLDIINNEYFKHENLEKYLKYYEVGMNGSAIVYIVNNDIKYTYNEKLVSIMNHKYFIARNLDRYMSYESDAIDEIIQNVNSNRDREFYTDIESSNLNKKELLLVNKYYQLEPSYYNEEMVTISRKYANKSNLKMNKEAYEALKEMIDRASEEDLNIRVLSAYRSYKTEEVNYNQKIKENGLEWTEKNTLRAGHSEHQTGLSLDLAEKGKLTTDGFEETKEFEWLEDNAKEFGFILRYDKEKENITGVPYKPYHFRYVGVSVAKYIAENNITYEEYYAYFVEQELASGEETSEEANKEIVK